MAAVDIFLPFLVIVFPVRYGGLQLSTASHCRSRRFVFFLVCFFLRLHIQLMLKQDFGFVFSSVRNFIFSSFAALAVQSLQTHRPVVGPCHTDLLSDPVTPTCCRTLSHRPVVGPCHTDLLSDPVTPTCCRTLSHRPVVGPSPTTFFFVIYIKRPHRLETMIVTRVALLTSVLWCSEQK